MKSTSRLNINTSQTMTSVIHSQSKINTSSSIDYVPKAKPRMVRQLAKIITTKSKKGARSLSPLAEENTIKEKAGLNFTEIGKATKEPLKKTRRRRDERKKEKANLVNGEFITNKTAVPNIYFPITSPQVKHNRSSNYNKQIPGNMRYNDYD